MKKIKMWILVITFILTLAGCGKAELKDHRPVNSQETTEMLERSVPAPTGYASEEVQRISIFYDGSLYLYHATGFDLPKEEDWEFLGKVVSVNNLEWPVEDFCGTHLDVGQEVYRKPSEPHKLYVKYDKGFALFSSSVQGEIKQASPTSLKLKLTNSGNEVISYGDAYPPCVMIDGILYKDTGYISSMAGCGTMDGEIVSAVPETELPSENEQSNFGSGYPYQRSSEGQVIVMIDDQRVIFRDIKKSETEIPMEVIHFTGSVKEITDGGELLVTHICTAEGFQMNDGDYYVSTENMRDEVFVGDVVEVWFNGTIQETDPAKLGCVYKIEKVD